MAIPSGLLQGIDNLDPLPVTAQKLTTKLSDENVSIAEITDIVEYDQAIASNVLRIANSALYVGKMPIENLRSAVARLGTKTLLSILLHDHLRRLTIDAPLYDLSENDLWAHGAAASLAVGELVAECPDVAIPEDAPIAALVHDIGKLIIVRYMKADVQDLLDLSQKKKVSFVEAEREVLGTDHAEVGGAIASRWKFPEAITRTVEQHHSVPLPDPTPMMDAVMMANLVTKTLGVGLGAEGMNFSTDFEAVRRLGLTYSAFCRVCARTSMRLNDLLESYAVTVH
jgi:putative nucleotidyltransferase with HDIG domain